MLKEEALRKFFPDIFEFREMQEPAIDKLLAGENVLCLMPTGSGKSLIYQVAGICMGKTVLVISPLIALMSQHHKKMLSAGLSSVNFSGLDYKEQFSILTNMAVSTMPQFIFTSPERISTDGYFEFIMNLRSHDIGLVVIDEVHCISQWGDGFRPSYRNIPAFLNSVFGSNSWPVVLCLTATLNAKEQKQVEADFRIKNTLKCPNLWRSNLKLEIIDLKSGKEESKKVALESLLEKHKGEKILVFVHRKYGNKGTTRTLSAEFQSKYQGVSYFDSDIPDNDKEAVLEGFMNGTIKIVFATSAFGMGVDIPDIRVVINYLISETVEQYYQEVGRAGRDGIDSFGYLLYTDQSKNGRKMLLRNSLCTEKDIRDEYDLRKLKPEDIFNSISFSSMTEEQRIAFSLLVDYGTITILAKGLQSLSCLSPITPAGKMFLDDMYKYSKVGFCKIICKRSGRTISSITSEIWKMCADGHLRIIKSPSKAVFFSITPELDESILSTLIADQENKKNLRMANFDMFVAHIEEKHTAEEIIRESLGI